MLIDPETQQILRNATREKLAVAIIFMAQEIANLRQTLAISGIVPS